MRSLFIHDPADLEAVIPGGVQLCTREFLEIVRAASDECQLFTVRVSRSAVWRLRRRLGLGAYLLYAPEEAREALAKTLATLKPSHVFLNRAELMRLAPLITSLAPGAKVIVMSHGNQSGDDLYEIAGPGGRRSGRLARITAAWRLGLDLVSESRFRHRHLHAVCVMSEEEAVLERWLGAVRTVVLPRIIRSDPLEWRPIDGRVGFVGTLDHTPNRVALVQLCDELAKLAGGSTIKLRLAGGPESVGRSFTERYPFVEYIGRPDEGTLRAEAATWTLFLNPIFWLSRGASMKLGQSLAWGVPALTTRSGARGYRLRPEHTFSTEDSPQAFAAALIALVRSQPARPSGLRERLLRSGSEWPDVATLAAELKAALA